MISLRAFGWVCAPAVFTVFCLANGQSLMAQQADAPRRMSSDADVYAALEKTVTVEFNKSPLSDVAEYIADAVDVDVDVDARRLEKISDGFDWSVTLNARRMRIKSLLNHVLAQLCLAYTVRNGTLVISTPEALDDVLVERAYPVGDLAFDDPSRPGLEKFDALIDSVVGMIRPEDWEDVGGVGTTAARDDAIVVKQTLEVHAQIEQYLTALRAARKASTKHPDRAPAITSYWAIDGDGPQIRATLMKRVPLSFIEKPLAEVAAQLAEATDTNILLDERALEDVGIGADTPVTFQARDIALSGGLSLMLRELDLTWEIRDDALLITTPEEAESRVHVHVYPVLDLVRMKEAGELELDEEFNDYETFITVLTNIVRPTTWDIVGGYGSVLPAGSGCLAIAQTSDVFEEIDAFLAAYRTAMARRRGGPQGELIKAVAVDEALHGRLRKVLQQEIDALHFKDASLGDVLRVLSEHLHVPFRIDHYRLEDIGLSAASTITARLENEPLGVALRKALAAHGLAWTLRNGVILITSKEEAVDTLVVKFYPVADLIERDDDLDVNAEADRCALLHDAIVENVDPDSWWEVGGPGTLETPPHPVLIVSQREEVHESVANLLAKRRETEKQQRDAKDGQRRQGESGDARRMINNNGETLYIRNYELQETSIDETETIAELVRNLVEPSSWDGEGGCSLRPSMTGATLVVRHRAAVHRLIHELLIELDVLPGAADAGIHAGGLGGLGGGWNTPPVSRVARLSLSDAHANNAFRQRVVLRIVRLDPENSKSPAEFADEIRRAVAPETWREDSTAKLHIFRQQLIIRHTSAVHRSIYRRLSDNDALLKPPPATGGFF